MRERERERECVCVREREQGKKRVRVLSDIFDKINKKEANDNYTS